MTRRPEDQACDDLLLDHEAERKELEVRMLDAATPQFEAAGKAVRKLLPVGRATDRHRKARHEIAIRTMALAIAAHINDVPPMIQRQTREQETAFAGRSGEPLLLEPITNARLKARQQARTEAAKQLQKHFHADIATD